MMLKLTVLLPDMDECFVRHCSRNANFAADCCKLTWWRSFGNGGRGGPGGGGGYLHVCDFIGLF